MADFENEVLEKEAEKVLDEAPAAASKPAFLKVVLPILLAQLILAYFLASSVLVPAFVDSPEESSAAEASSSVDEASQGEQPTGRDFGIIHTLEDIIVNPKNSEGGRFILINLALEVSSNSDIDILKTRDVQLRDILIQLISGKTITELDDPQDKENLRQEIRSAISGILPPGHLRNVYFSNYLIQ